MAKVRFTSKNLKPSDSKEDMKTPRKSPRKKDDEKGEAAQREKLVVGGDKDNLDDSDMETTLITPGMSKKNAKSSNKTILNLSNPSVPVSGGDKNSVKSDARSESLRGSDKAFKSPKGSDQESSEASGSDKNESDDESIVKKKRKSQRSTRKRGTKRVDGNSDEDDETHVMRKSGRTPKPVELFQIKEKLNTKDGADDSEEDSDANVNSDNDQSDYELHEKKQNGKSEKRGSTGKSKNTGSKNKKPKPAGRPRRKVTTSDEEESELETDEDSIFEVIRGRPGPKSKTRAAGSRKLEEPPAKKTKQDKTESENETHLNKKSPLKAVVTVDCGRRVASSPKKNGSGPILTSPRKSVPGSSSNAVVNNNIDLSNLASVKLDEDMEYIDLKKLYLSKQIELMDHDIYCRKLESLKRERELHLELSPITRELLDMSEPSRKSTKL